MGEDVKREQIPSAVGVAYPEGITIPRVLSHATRSGEPAASHQAPRLPPSLPCFWKYPVVKRRKAGTRNAGTANYNLPSGKYFPNPRQSLRGMSPEELWFNIPSARLSPTS